MPFAVQYPAALDNLPDPNAVDRLSLSNGYSHSEHHKALNDTVEAIGAKVGVDGSSVATSIDYRLTHPEGAVESAKTSNYTVQNSDTYARFSNAGASGPQIWHAAPFPSRLTSTIKPHMNRLYYGDNLQILRDKVETESVDLIYLDPPFNSKADYNVLFKNHSGEVSTAQATAFKDTWEWDKAAADAYHELMMNPATPHNGHPR